MGRDEDENFGTSAGDALKSGGAPSQGMFPQTRWTLVQQMQDPALTCAGADALNELCQIYWKPVFSYVRSWGKSPTDAEDLTQGFFAMLLSKRSLSDVAADKGKLRTFLLVALKRFLANEHHRENAQKRGGGQRPLSIDADWAESQPRIDPADKITPDLQFDRQWALTVLNQALTKLEDNYASNGKREVFEVLKFSISPSEASVSIAEASARLGISESATKVASHRLRKRYRQALAEVIGETVDGEQAVQEEIAYLLSVFRD